MQEEYLHYLWRLKRLPLNDLKLTDGRKMKLLNTGWYNVDAGPDFFNGSVSIDGITWSGNIELHVKSSDWYAHKHHIDPAYDNVVLHVVLEHDKEVIVKNELLPTLELKDKIDYEHWKNYEKVISFPEQIPCSGELSLDSFIIEQQINISLFQRLERKGMELLSFLKADQNNKKRALLTAIFQSFGGRVNKLPFIELAQILPLEIIAKEKWDLTRMEALMFGCAGMLRNENLNDEYSQALNFEWQLLRKKYDLPQMKYSSWKFGGMRPYSFPSFKLAQLSSLLYHWDLHFRNILDADSVISELQSKFDLPVSDYWETHFILGKKAKEHKSIISKSAFHLVLINGIVPYLIYLKHVEHQFEYSDVVLNILEQIAPEKNNITKKWSDLGITPKNALESQGLIELKNEFCNFKKCLSCKIGHHILEKV